jgi:hypothetical protein
VCCGDSYQVTENSLDVKPCPVHVRFCVHWEAIWLHPSTHPGRAKMRECV